MSSVDCFFFALAACRCSFVGLHTYVALVLQMPLRVKLDIQYGASVSLGYRCEGDELLGFSCGIESEEPEPCRRGQLQVAQHNRIGLDTADDHPESSVPTRGISHPALDGGPDR